MKLRPVVPYVVVVAVLLVASLQSASPGAHPDPDPTNLDLLASAQPTTVQPAVADAAYDELKTRDWDVKADAAATTSAECDGCVGESTALQIVYASRAGVARLDNSAVAWTQSCQGCSGSALSVQVVVLSGRSEVHANNRSMAVTAGCNGCRTASAAFQVVVVADRARRLSRESLTGLRTWFDEQAAALRASVALPIPDPATPEPSPTPEPTTPTDSPTAEPTDGTSPPTDPTDPMGRPYTGRRAKRVSIQALAELEGLVTAALGADAIVADVDLGR